MLISTIKSEYVYITLDEPKSHILLRAIKRFFTNRKFRLGVLVKDMLSSKSKGRRTRKRNRLLKKYSCDIGEYADIGHNLNLPHPVGVVIGQFSAIGDNCTIYQNVTIGQKNEEYPKIGNSVTIFPSSVIIGDITIGDRATIGAGSVVLCNVPPGVVFAGNPAKEITKEDCEKWS